MPIYPPLILFAIVFFELFVLLRMSKDANAIITLSKEILRILRSPEIGDDDREIFAKDGAVMIFKATCRFSIKLLSIDLAIYCLYLLTTPLFSNLKTAMIDSLVSPSAIVTLTAATVFYAWTRKGILALLRNRA